MRILVTGGAGYIGSHTVRLLAQRGHAVTVFDNLSQGHRGAVPSECLVIGDLADAPLLEETLVRHRIEAIVHFAAFAYVGESVQQPARYYHNNLVNTLSLMECARRRGVSRFVFSSTCATYGLPQRLPISEEMPQMPINPYGNSKLAVERALLDYATAYNWGIAILRYFNAAGASADGTLGEDHDPETHLIPLVAQAALGRRPFVDVFGVDYPTPDGTCIRDYIHVEDLAQAHALAVERLEQGNRLICNVGLGHGYSVREVIQMVEQTAAVAVPVRERPRRPGDPPVLVASSERLQSELGWQPRYRNLQEIVATAWRWHRDHPDGYVDPEEPFNQQA